MNNGQLNMVSVPTVTPLATQGPTVPVTDAKDGVQQSGGGFNGLLSGIQFLAKVKPSPDSAHAGQSQVRIGKDQPVLDATGDGHAVDLLAQLHVSPVITPASEPAAPKQEEPENVGINTDAVPLGSEPSDLASQMAVAAYLQTGRMPEVNTPTLRAVDRLQNVASVTAQPAVISVSADKPQSLQAVAESVPASQAITTIPPESANESAAASDRIPEVNESTLLPVDRLQNAASVAAQSAVISASAAKTQSAQAVAEPIQTSDVNMPVQLVSANESAPVSSPQPAAPIKQLQSELPLAPSTTSAPVYSPESEVEIQLSQPQPITARATAEPAVAGNRSTELIPETRGGRQHFTTEQQIEKSRSGNETNVVKEMTSSLQSAASSGESPGDSGTPHGSNSNQGQPDSAADNQMLAQQMHGQLSTEHQKVTAVTARSVSAEPVRQDIPEQVMQQVKERLVQHDVKPGNQQITLTLSPDSLGELKMNLNLQGQKLSVEIVTENRTVRDTIMQHTDALKESLARQNITMSSFDVTTGGKESGNQGQNQNAWRELAKQQQQQSWSPPRGYHIAQADLPSGQAAYQRQQGQSMLDIHY